MMINVRNLFRKNLPAKILAIIASIIMWGYVMNEENPAVNARYTIPVEVVNAPEGYDVTLDTKEVTLKVRATRALMASAMDSDFRAIIDLSGNTEGEYDVKIKAIVPQGFELLDMSEDTVHVSMESLIAHGVPVEIAVSGKAVQGMEVSSVQPVQQYVNVFGPRHLVESVVKTTGKIKLSDNTSDFTMRVKLAAVNATGDEVENLTILPPEMDVTVQLTQAKVKKTVPVKAAVTGILPEGYTLGEVKVQPTQLEISGSSKDLEDIKSLGTVPVNLAGMTAGSVQEIDVVLPAGVDAAEKKVTVSVEINSK